MKQSFIVFLSATLFFINLDAAQAMSLAKFSTEQPKIQKAILENPVGKEKEIAAFLLEVDALQGEARWIRDAKKWAHTWRDTWEKAKGIQKPQAGAQAKRAPAPAPKREKIAPQGAQLAMQDALDNLYNEPDGGAKKIAAAIDAGADPNYYYRPAQKQSFQTREGVMTRWKPEVESTPLIQLVTRLQNIQDMRYPPTFENTKALLTMLINKGARVDGRDGNGTTALMIAATNPTTFGATEILLDLGADISAVDNNHENALGYAARAASDHTIKLLLIPHALKINRADVLDNQTNDRGWTPLIEAIGITVFTNDRDINKRIASINALIAAGANPLLKTKGGTDALKFIQLYCQGSNDQQCKDLIARFEKYVDEWKKLQIARVPGLAHIELEKGGKRSTQIHAPAQLIWQSLVGEPEQPAPAKKEGEKKKKAGK